MIYLLNNFIRGCFCQPNCKQIPRNKPVYKLKTHVTVEVYVRRFISKGEGLQSKCTVANLEIFLTGFLAAELVDECIGNLVLRVRTERFFRKIK